MTTTTATTMAGGVFQWRLRWTTARRWGQKEMNQSNRVQRRHQGKVKGIGGTHLGVGGMLSHLSSGGGKEDSGRRGGSAPDKGAGVVGIGHLLQRSMPVGNQGRSSLTDRWQEGSKGANLLGHMMVEPTDQPTMRHWVRKPEAKKICLWTEYHTWWGGQTKSTTKRY